MIDQLDALRAALGRGEVPAPDPAGAVEVVRRPNGEVDHVRVTPAVPIDLDELASRFGPARTLPRLPSGGRRALFPATLPADGERAITVLAELDLDGRAAVVVLRPDDLR